MVKKIISILLLLIVGVTLFSGCSSTTSDNTQIKNPQEEANKDNIAEDNSENLLSDQKAEKESEQPVEEVQDIESSETKLSSCDALPNKLDLCETFSCEEKNGFTGTMTQKKVLGIIEDKCVYTEDTDGIIMECKYSEDFRKEVAEYIRAMANYETREFKHTNDPETGKPITLEVIDGKEFTNPTNKAFDEEICIMEY